MSIALERPAPVRPAVVVGLAVGPRPAHLRLRLLGGFELTVDDAPCELPPAAARLVAFLALSGRPMPRSYVAGVLWGDRSDERAAACLRSAIWRANGTHPVIQAGRTRLALADVWVDAVAAADAAHAQIAGGRPVEPGLLTGELLPGWYDEWVEVERERLGQLCLEGLEQMARAYLREGRWCQAIEAALGVVAVEPLRESAHRVLIEAHTGAGNRAAALRQYEACRAVMRRDLGMEPGAAVRRAAAEARTADR